ncbi:hypothetical protein RhoFW510R10_11550 [Rhodanobacter sp. FW510-R10]|nr:hypothetical protein RhoFW510R10_11550 [Rhodanobacter sp. FW510-R10]
MLHLVRSPAPKRLTLAVAALLAAAGAQATDLRYTFASTDFKSLGAAEAAMRAANPNWDAALSLCKVSRESSATALAYCTSQQLGTPWINIYRTPGSTRF